MSFSFSECCYVSSVSKHMELTIDALHRLKFDVFLGKHINLGSKYKSQITKYFQRASSRCSKVQFTSKRVNRHFWP